ncbi:MAG: hypothetical protein LWX56_14560 [Ignavibacteria bacterium]|nr:hypothetical protein [Ignavibacteria bacterium]
MIKLLKYSLTTATRFVYQNKKLSLLYWFTNLGFALALSVPMYALIQGNLLHSSMNAHITNEFDFIWFLQFRFQNKSILDVFPPMIYTVTLLYNLIQLFFSGGLLSLAGNPQKDHIVDFFFGGVRYFFRFFILFLITVALYFVVISLNSLMFAGIQWVFTNSDNTLLQFIAHLFRYVFFVFLIGIVNLLADYSRIVIASHDDSHIFRSIVKCLIFVKNKFTIVSTLFFVLASCIGLAAIGYNLVDGLIPKSSWLLIIATFVIQQMLIIFRLIIRMVFYTSEFVLYNDISAEIVKPQFEEVL